MIKLTPYQPENAIQPGPAISTMTQHEKYYNGGYVLNLLAEAHEHYQSQAYLALLHKMAQAVGKVVVPLRLTGAMNRIIESDGWEWADLLAAAEAIDEPTYDALCGEDEEGPTIAQMEAGAAALKRCNFGMDECDAVMEATADSVYRAMQKAAKS